MQGKGRVETGRDPNNLNGANIAGGLGSLRHMLNVNPNKYGYLADTGNPTTATSRLADADRRVGHLLE